MKVKATQGLPLPKAPFQASGSISTMTKEKGTTGTEELKPEPKLRHVETDVLIPKMMREKARELCAEQVQAFTKCCSETGFLMVVKCREENTALKDCLTAYYKDPAFYEECKTQYLKEKEEFQRTGIPSKQRHQKVPTSM
ncbi:COX assembly mitochondrial protein homolog isoform X2 [Ambystoma mexicanum]|uniref:COX assembly mitochondrial protein homolog isoform X2 n=1 Tax=Ambystoma mexicanum TaxID=8296 RepID=UPI0037E7EB14